VSTATLTADVATAVDEVVAAFPPSTVTCHPDGQGGAHVIVDAVGYGAQYSPATGWIGFHITFQYPLSDCYPHFVTPDLHRADGRPLGEAMSLGTFGFDGRQAIQISRRSNHLDPAHDTALTKLLKVLDWLGRR